MNVKSSREQFRKAAQQLNRDANLIAQLEEYIVRLESKGLPIIFSTAHLSLSLGLNIKSLDVLIDFRKNLYRPLILRKKNGGTRCLLVPSSPILEVQYWIKENILDVSNFPSYVTGYQKGKSIIDNATFHSNQEIIIKFDLKNFYDSITVSRVYCTFRYLGYGKSISIDLAKLCTAFNENGKEILPQGSPSSPAISNIVCSELDRRLYGYAVKCGFNYSRYSDDITFSGPKSDTIKKTVIYRIIEECGFQINAKKTKYIGSGNCQRVTGLNVNNGVTISKKKRKMIETHLHNCLRFGPYVHLKKIDMSYRTNYREWLLGNIYFIMSVHSNQGKKMKAKFDKINWIA